MPRETHPGRPERDRGGEGGAPRRPFPKPGSERTPVNAGSVPTPVVAIRSGSPERTDEIPSSPRPASDPVTGFLPPLPPAPAGPPKPAATPHPTILGPTRGTSTKRPAAYHPRGTRTRPARPRFRPGAAPSALREPAPARSSSPPPTLFLTPAVESRDTRPGRRVAHSRRSLRGAPWSAPARAAYGQLCNPASLKPSQPPSDHHPPAPPTPDAPAVHKNPNHRC